MVDYELGKADVLVSRQAESNQPKPRTGFLKPSKEVEAKMRPIARAHFDDLLKRAIRQPAHKPSSKRK